MGAARGHHPLVGGQGAVVREHPGPLQRPAQLESGPDRQLAAERPAAAVGASVRAAHLLGVGPGPGAVLERI